MFKKIRDTYASFEAWLNRVLPATKTKLVAFAGIAYPAALAVQSYVQGLPLDQMIGSKPILIANVVMFSLVFWLRNLNDRVEARAEADA
jgi:hypothetical protein